MARYHEVSSLLTDYPTSTYVAFDSYGKVLNYYPDVFDRNKNKKYFWYLAAENPSHPLGKRFDKLIRYVARLTNNPDPQKIKRDYLKLLKNGEESPATYHDLFHLIIGQSLEIFIKKKKYTIEEYIYEVIALALEYGYYKSDPQVSMILGITISKAIEYNAISVKKLFYKELKIVRYYLKKHNRLTNKNYVFFKNLILRYGLITKFHLYTFLKLYDMDPRYPLAVNFKNEALRELPNILSREEYVNYYKKFYSFIDSVYKELEHNQSSNIVEYFKEKLLMLSDFAFSPGFIRELFSRIEVFPSETKEIVRKFLKYMDAVLERYLAVKAQTKKSKARKKKRKIQMRKKNKKLNKLF